MPRKRNFKTYEFRRTLFDALPGVEKNVYCKLEDLSNEASVETFFINRLLTDLGYEDSQIQTKKSLTALTVSHGRKKERYKPDYAMIVNGEPRCVIEAKGVGEDLDDWVEQCSGYCLSLNRKFTNSNPVRYFLISNGKTTRLYEWDKEDPILELMFGDFDWSNDKFQQLRKFLGARTILESMPVEVHRELERFLFERATSEKARQLFALCHNVIWKSEVCSPSAAFMEFAKLMFVKLWEDRKLRANPRTSKAFAAGKSAIYLPESTVLFSLSWIEERHNEGTNNPINDILFARLRDDLEQEIKLGNKKRVFETHENIKLKPDTIKAVVRRLEHYDLFGIDEDLNGRLFETFLSATMRGRELGQFFTPRSIVKMMVYLADLKANRKEQSYVIDGCCGSGGFLIEALTVMRNQIRADSSLSADERRQLIQTVSNECIYGIDLGKDPPLARIARLNMYLHGDGGSRIFFADALDKKMENITDSDPEVVLDRTELQKDLQKVKFDVVLTNPPFSMSKQESNETERKLLVQYDIGRRSPSSASLRLSLRSSILYLERYYELLKPGGHLLTVIDDTLLASEKFNFVRDFIRDRFLIRAIISLSGDAFQRSGSRVKTSVIVLQKKKTATDTQPSCFGYFSRYLGVDDLNPRASPLDIEEARSKADTEIKEILEGYQSYLEGKPSPSIIPPDRLTNRLDLKFCVPEYGRMVESWIKAGVEVKHLKQVVTPISDLVIPKEHPKEEFTLIKVSYEGRCEIDKIKIGARVNYEKMYRVKTGQMVFSTMRSTDGAVGIVPEEMDGALVSKNYTVFDCGTPEDAAYLWSILRSHEIRADMQSQSPGSNRYNTRWPAVGELKIPWLQIDRRREIGRGLISSWKLERRALTTRAESLKAIEGLGLETAESKARFLASRAPV